MGKLVTVAAILTTCVCGCMAERQTPADKKSELAAAEKGVRPGEREDGSPEKEARKRPGVYGDRHVFLVWQSGVYPGSLNSTRYELFQDGRIEAVEVIYSNAGKGRPFDFYDVRDVEGNILVEPGEYYHYVAVERPGGATHFFSKEPLPVAATRLPGHLFKDLKVLGFATIRHKISGKRSGADFEKSPEAGALMVVLEGTFEPNNVKKSP